ncbi:MAG: LemA family protein [Leadbetterella sp.]
MNKSIIVILVIFVLFGFYGCSKYNGMVGSDTDVNTAWSKVQSQYQRRADLIGNLIKTVQGQADFESKTLTEIVEARASATQIKLDAKDLTPENMSRYQAAQDQLQGSLSRLMMVSENYPNLRTSEAFGDLRAELSGTENRITVARNDFNDVAGVYNKSIRTFPNVLFAGMFGFQQKAQFQASQKAQDAPDVNFDFKKE